MEVLDSVVADVQATCKRKGVDVTKPLAGFVVRMTIYEHPEDFPPTQSMDEEALRNLVKLSSDYLLQKNNPSTETVKMQVAFDVAYFEAQDGLRQHKERIERSAADIERRILSAAVGMDAADFEGLAGLYKQVFAFLTALADAPAANRSGVRQEIAVGLESVFPRVGLKSFLKLSESEKRYQLTELYHLILGIRLFNWNIGKGGAGISDVPKEANELGDKLEHELGKMEEGVDEVCSEYVDVLADKQTMAELEESGTYAEHPKGLSGRWKAELMNRRQLSAYVTALREDVAKHAEAVRANTSSFISELEDLKRLVGGRSSVPKEQVYPKFHHLAQLWSSIESDNRSLVALNDVLGTLKEYSAPTVCTMDLTAVRKARKAARAKHGSGSIEAKDSGEGSTAMEQSNVDSTSTGKLQGGGAEGKEPTAPVVGEGPLRLSTEASPHVMQLHVALQGFCPWTIVTRDGLLLPGDSSVGLVRYKGEHYVFVSEEALQHFMADPERYLQGVAAAAGAAPELIGLLSLPASQGFPQPFDAAVPTQRARSAQGGDAGSQGPLAGATAGEPPVMVDAATATPVHFVEKHIDPTYEWSEWALRRKALKIANLKNCRTRSTQSDESHYKQTAATQVYPQRAKAIQTLSDKGTNTKQQHRFLSGLRGGVPVPIASEEQRKLQVKEGESGPGGGGSTQPLKTQAKMVTLTLDL